MFAGLIREIVGGGLRADAQPRRPQLPIFTQSLRHQWARLDHVASPLIRSSAVSYLRVGASRRSGRVSYRDNPSRTMKHGPKMAQTPRERGCRVRRGLSRLTLLDAAPRERCRRRN